MTGLTSQLNVSKHCPSCGPPCFASGSSAVLPVTHYTRGLGGKGGKTSNLSNLTDRLPVVARIPAGPLGSLKCDPPKGNAR